MVLETQALVYGQCEVNHKSGGRECTASAVDYDTLCEGGGEIVVDFVVVGRPFGWRAVIQPKNPGVNTFSVDIEKLLGGSTACFKDVIKKMVASSRAESLDQNRHIDVHLRT